MGPVEEAVRAEVERMGAEAVASALGASAVDLGRRQDEAHLPSQAAQVAKELRETLRVLAERFPPALEQDGLDELRARRERGA
jgi:hypothetical protein